TPAAPAVLKSFAMAGERRAINRNLSPFRAAADSIKTIRPRQLNPRNPIRAQAPRLQIPILGRLPEPALFAFRSNLFGITRNQPRLLLARLLLGHLSYNPEVITPVT